MSAWVSPGTRCVCGHTIEQHALRCEADDVICGCVRFRVVSPPEAWVCNDPGCAWSGPRVEVDSHIRTTYHGCSPRPTMKACPSCGGQINAGSSYCRLCRTQLVAIQLPPRPY